MRCYDAKPIGRVCYSAAIIAIGLKNGSNPASSSEKKAHKVCNALVCSTSAALEVAMHGNL